MREEARQTNRKMMQDASQAPNVDIVMGSCKQLCKSLCILSVIGALYVVAEPNGYSCPRCNGGCSLPCCSVRGVFTVVDFTHHQFISVLAWRSSESPISRISSILIPEIFQGSLTLFFPFEKQKPLGPPP